MTNLNPKTKKPNQVKGIDYDGMNQQEVADALGITRAAVQHIEKRAYNKFRRELAKRLKHINELL
jgi:DNA-directed RNA polymerase specialized sigma subunit